MNASEETEFTVTWEIQVTAATHEEAARKAKAMQSDPDSTADVYEVIDEDPDRPGKLRSVTVDLSELDGRSTD